MAHILQSQSLEMELLIQKVNAYVVWLVVSKIPNKRVSLHSPQCQQQNVSPYLLTFPSLMVRMTSQYSFNLHFSNYAFKYFFIFLEPFSHHFYELPIHVFLAFFYHVSSPLFLNFSWFFTYWVY